MLIVEWTAAEPEHQKRNKENSMSNRFGIPKDIEQKLRNRDQRCVYCGRMMNAPATKTGGMTLHATIEHFNRCGPFYWNIGLKEEDLAICCGRCNSSRGQKTLREWFKSSYCISRSINEKTVAAPVKRYLAKSKR